MKIAIIDYGMGNIKSLSSSLENLGINEIILSSDFDLLRSADRLILPGVGSFGKAIEQIKNKNLDIILDQLVIREKKPILGICLGMQLMGISSNEDGYNNGLGFVKGIVEKFDPNLGKVPHVGFNQVMVDNNQKIYKNFNNLNYDFYFTHSYKMRNDLDIDNSLCNYNGYFVASFESENIAGVQFHPELSQKQGLKLISNFIENFNA